MNQRKFRIMVFIITLCGLFIAACSQTAATETAVNEVEVEEPTATEVDIATQIPTSTETPTQIPATSTPTPQPTKTPEPVVYLADDFSDTDSGWEHYRAFDGILDYENDTYRMMFELTDRLFWVQRTMDTGDIAIEIDVQKQGGAETSFQGVLCRMDEKWNYYFFAVSGDGKYGIGRVINRQREWLGTGELEASTAVKTGTEVNQIKAVCDGDQLSFYVNDQLLLQVTDDVLVDGKDYGMFIASMSEPGNDVLFDNLRVLAP